GWPSAAITGSRPVGPSRASSHRPLRPISGSFPARLLGAQAAPLMFQPLHLPAALLPPFPAGAGAQAQFARAIPLIEPARFGPSRVYVGDPLRCVRRQARFALGSNRPSVPSVVHSRSASVADGLVARRVLQSPQ